MPKFNGTWYNHLLHTSDKVKIDARDIVEACNALLLYMRHWGGDQLWYNNITSIVEQPDNSAITYDEQLKRYKDTHGGNYPEFLKWSEHEIKNERHK